MTTHTFKFDFTAKVLAPLSLTLLGAAGAAAAFIQRTNFSAFELPSWEVQLAAAFGLSWLGLGLLLTALARKSDRLRYLIEYTGFSTVALAVGALIGGTLILPMTLDYVDLRPMDILLMAYGVAVFMHLAQGERRYLREHPVTVAAH